MLLLLLPAVAQDASIEYAVKATYLYKFAPFVEWPATATRAGAPLSICVMQNDEMRALVERAVSGQKLEQRPFVVRDVKTLEGAQSCHILYVGMRDGELRRDVLSALRGVPTLTVTDGAAETTSKGVINFVLDQNRVRFEIDDLRAAENGLLISSKLLSLAVSVRPRA